MFFAIVVSIVVLQRIVELMIAKRNEQWMKEQGAYEVGKEHYPLIVFVHVGFFVSLIFEVLLLNKAPASWWLMPFALFVIAQAGRVWSIHALGRFWNTKIIILPGANVVKRGPYKYIRHPNYLIVFLEILLLPLVFEAYYTAVIFTFFNLAVLFIRIMVEENELIEATDYKEVFLSERLKNRS